MNLNKIKLKLWEQGRLDYLLHEAQLVIFNTLSSMDSGQEKEIMLLSSRRFGKSYFSIIYSFMKCLSKPKMRILVVAPNKLQAREIIDPIIDFLLSESPSEGLVKKTKSNYKLNFHNGSSLTIAGADTAAESIRGKGFDLAILEESCSWAFETCEYVLKNVIKPTLLHSKEPIKIIHATTPSSKYIDHPFHNLINSIKTFKFTIHDNPLLSDEQIQEAIDDCGGEDSHTFKVEYLCEVSRNENYSVLPNFKNTAIATPTKFRPAILGSLDEGGVRDNTAFVQLKQCGDGRYFLTGSKQWGPKTTIDEQIAFIKDKYHTLVADASGQVRVELASKGVTTIFPDKLDRDLAIKDLDLAFKANNLFVDSSYEELFKALNTATWNNQRTDFERTEEFGHADLLMACVYAWRMRRLLDSQNKREEERIAQSLLTENDVTYYTRPKETSEKKLANILRGRRK